MRLHWLPHPTKSLYRLQSNSAIRPDKFADFLPVDPQCFDALAIAAHLPAQVIPSPAGFQPDSEPSLAKLEEFVAGSEAP